MVKDDSLEHFGEIGIDLVIIIPVMDLFADVVHHLHDLDIGAAVSGSFE